MKMDEARPGDVGKLHTWRPWQERRVNRSPPEISSKLLRGPPPLLHPCLHPTADLPAVQTTVPPWVFHLLQKEVHFFILLSRPPVPTAPRPPAPWPTPSVAFNKKAGETPTPPSRVCWYYQQTVWLCLSECDDRTKHWYLLCDNRLVWTGSVR